MSEPERPPTQEPENSPQPGGINLILAYSLIALALFTAIGFAVLMVLPFYNRR